MRSIAASRDRDTIAEERKRPCRIEPAIGKSSQEALNAGWLAEKPRQSQEERFEEKLNDICDGKTKEKH